MCLVVIGPDGRCVRRLRATGGSAGIGEVTWDGRDAAGRPVPSGTYFGRLETPSERATVPLRVIR